jgi:hypothetical protein
MTDKFKRLEQAAAAYEQDPNYNTGGELEFAAKAAGKSPADSHRVSEFLMAFSKRCRATWSKRQDYQDMLKRTGQS